MTVYFYGRNSDSESFERNSSIQTQLSKCKSYANIKDLKIVDLICNNVAYLGNDFPVEVRLHARGFKGVNIKSTISINGTAIM